MSSVTIKTFGMRLSECNNCRHSREVDCKSYCHKENIFSYLSNCIQKKALKFYLTNNKIT